MGVGLGGTRRKMPGGDQKRCAIPVAREGDLEMSHYTQCTMPLRSEMRKLPISFVARLNKAIARDQTPRRSSKEASAWHGVSAGASPNGAECYPGDRCWGELRGFSKYTCYLFFPLAYLTFLFPINPTTTSVSSLLHTFPLFDRVSTTSISILHILGLGPFYQLHISL